MRNILITQNYNLKLKTLKKKMSRLWVMTTIICVNEYLIMRFIRNCDFFFKYLHFQIELNLG